MITYRLRGLINLHAFAVTLFVGLFFLGYAVSVGYLPGIRLSRQVNLPLYFCCVIASMVLSSKFINHIGSRFHRLTWVDAAWLATRQVVMLALGLFTVMAALKDRNVSRLFLASFLVLSWCLLFVANNLLPRFLARLAFHKSHRLPTLFIGRQKSLARLSEWIAQKEHLGIQPVGFLSDEEIEGDSSSPVGFLGPVNALARMLEEKKVSQVIVLDLPSDEQEISFIIQICQGEGCRLLIYNNIEERVPVPLTPIVEEGHFFYTMQEEPLEDPLNRMLKRACDIAISLPVVLFIMPPLSLLVWAVQRLQAPGPVFFVRKRGGHRRLEFDMLKFRSMYHAAADERHEARQARAGDSRIYPFGAFLRKSSLDEFPQFINVLRGDMSIVGPRPHLPRHDDEFARIAKSYRTRSLVKPGITGLAQTSGFRGEISDPEVLRRRVHFDIYYITHWSIWLDLQIIVRTALQVFLPPKTAY